MGRAEFARRLRSASVAGPMRREHSVGEGGGAAMVIEEASPDRFVEAFMTAAAGSGPVFLADPSWGTSEREQLAALLNARGEPAPARWRRASSDRGWLMIPSGGTSGRLKFARHDEETIAAAVGGFLSHFSATRIDALGVLPLHHVSGFMAWMRCALTSGAYVAGSWKALERGDIPALPPSGGFRCVSLVPTQVHRLLGSPAAVAWLRQYDAVFLGGGPPWPELLEAAARAELPLCPSYGMTETAAMAAAQLPGEFRAGLRSSGRPLPHIGFATGESGTVRLSGESVFLGYYPSWRADSAFETEDLGSLDDRGQLHLSGRRDAVIITGGKKVDPEEVEAALRATGCFEDVAVIGLADEEWGGLVIACYPQSGPSPDIAAAARRLSQLAAFKRPRRYVPIEPWPRNAQGKLNRAALAGLAAGRESGSLP
ncbi:MAG: AMP-binding protein [Opitutaceae bacterium]